MNEKLRSTVAALVAGVGVFSILRWFRAKSEATERQPDARQEKLVDEAGEESFPASDPPSWTLGDDQVP